MSRISDDRNKIIPGWQGIAVSAGIAVLVTLLSTAVFAWALLNEMIVEDNAGYCTLVVLFISSLAGGIVGKNRNDGNKLFANLVSGIVYILFLLSMTAFIFGGHYRGIGVSTLVIASGCILPAILERKAGKKVKLRKSKNRYR